MTLLQNILLIFITGIIFPLAAFALRALTAYLESKTHCVKLQHALDIAEGIIEGTVAETSQTFVDGLKGTTKWTSNTAKKAFDQAKTRAGSFMSESIKNLIEKESGDFDDWLQMKIEAKVNELKNNKK